LSKKENTTRFLTGFKNDEKHARSGKANDEKNKKEGRIPNVEMNVRGV